MIDFLIFVVCTGLGSWIGSFYEHPWIGAFLGFFVALIIVCIKHGVSGSSSDGGFFDFNGCGSDGGSCGGGD